MLNDIKEAIEKHSDKLGLLRLAASVYGRKSDDFIAISHGFHDVRNAFANKSRHTGGAYHRHCASTAAIIIMYQRLTETKDVNLVLAALYHDVVEDLKEEGWSEEHLLFRTNKDVCSLVDSVTKPEKYVLSTEDEYVASTYLKVESGGKRSVILKVADRIHNLMTPFGDMRIKIMHTRKYLVPLAQQHDVLVNELVEVCNELEKSRFP